jgi:hypothetical protein
MADTTAYVKHLIDIGVQLSDIPAAFRSADIDLYACRTNPANLFEKFAENGRWYIRYDSDNGPITVEDSALDEYISKDEFREMINKLLQRGLLTINIIDQFGISIDEYISAMPNMKIHVIHPVKRKTYETFGNDNFERLARAFISCFKLESAHKINIATHYLSAIPSHILIKLRHEIIAYSPLVWKILMLKADYGKYEMRVKYIDVIRDILRKYNTEDSVRLLSVVIKYNYTSIKFYRDMNRLVYRLAPDVLLKLYQQSSYKQDHLYRGILPTEHLIPRFKGTIEPYHPHFKNMCLNMILYLPTIYSLEPSDPDLLYKISMDIHGDISIDSLMAVVKLNSYLLQLAPVHLVVSAQMREFVETTHRAFQWMPYKEEFIYACISSKHK